MCMLLWQLRFVFICGYQHRPRPYLTVILDGYKIGESLDLAAESAQ